MIITILIVLVMIIVPIIMYKTYNWDGLDNLFFDALIGFIGLLFFIISLGVSGETYFDNEHYELSETQSIVALQDNIGIEGHSSFLGCGHIEDKLYYFYAKKTENGTKINKLSSDECFVDYSKEPRIEKYKIKKFNKFIRYFYAWPNSIYYKIYVPEGTIQQNYNIDLQ